MTTLHWVETRPHDLRFNEGNVKTVDRWVRDEGWLVGINAGFFHLASGKPGGAMALHGIPHRSGGHDPGLVLYDDDRADIQPLPGFDNQWVKRMLFAIQAGPWLVRNGIVASMQPLEASEWTRRGISPSVPRPRTFAAIRDGGSVVLGVSPMATISGLARSVQALGKIKLAMAFDGGASSQMYVADPQVGWVMASVRPVPNAIGAMNILASSKTAPSNEPPIPTAILRYSGGVMSHGPAVVEAQTLLKKLGYDPGAIDGYFGPKSAAATMAFQRASSIVVDGIVGPTTWTMLYRRSR